MKRFIAILLILAMLPIPATFAAEKETAGKVIPQSAYDAVNADIWGVIEDIETKEIVAKRGKRASASDYAAIVDDVIAAVENSETFVEGSINRNGAFFTWETKQGIVCGYSPRLRAQIRASAVKNADPEQYSAIETVSYATKGGSSTAKNVAVFQPYYGIDSSFTTRYANEGKSIAQATGGTAATYKTTSATIDAIADALESCSVVIFDSHGDTDYYNYNNDMDFVSRANTSYLCLQTGTGLTTADMAEVTGTYGEYNHAYYAGTDYEDTSMKFYCVDGTAIANHMEKSAPNNMLWMAICLGMATEGLERPIHNKGVEVVYGYSESVTFDYDYAWEEVFWDNMIKGSTVAQSISAMKSEVGEWDYCDEYTTLSRAQRNYCAFPIVVSSEDVYPGKGNVDNLQTVNSTWKLKGSTEPTTPTQPSTEPTEDSSSPVTQSTFEKVTAEQSDWSGKYILVNEESASSAIVFKGVDEKGNVQSAAINSGKIAYADGMAVITVAKYGSGYSMQLENGTYLDSKPLDDYGNEQNGIVFSNTPAELAISMGSDGVDVIAATDSVLRYNFTSLLFRFYKSSNYANQKAVYLYKLTGTTPEPTEPTEESTEPTEKPTEPTEKPTEQVEDGTFVKVTAEQSDWSGKYLIAYEDSTSSAIVFKGTGNKNDIATAATDNGKIVYQDGMAIVTVTKCGNGYSIQLQDGTYIDSRPLDTNGNEQNGLEIVNSPAELSISKDSNGVDIIAAVGPHLRYNTDGYFRFYKSSSYSNQKSIQLYKLVGDTPEPTEPTEKPTEPTEKPTEPTEKPTEPTEKPTEPTEKPTEPTEKPTEPTEKPTEPTEKPTQPTEKPTQPTESAKVTVESADTENGVVFLVDNVVTAIPDNGYYVSGFLLLPAGAATVLQDGNRFYLTDIKEDCSLTVYFRAKENAEVKFSVPAGCKAASVTTCVGEPIELKAPSGKPVADAHEYAFVGWTEEPVKDEKDLPTVYTETYTPDSAETTLYALYTYIYRGDRYYSTVLEMKTCLAEKFNDVNTTAWYHEALDFVLEYGYMNGVEEFKFDPNGKLTRAMLVTILYRLEDREGRFSHPFEDVEEGKWYSEPIAWAYETGVVNGISETEFGPDEPITREQAAAMLYRYAKWNGEDVTPSGSLLDFEDAAKVSAFARDPMRWAVGNKIINGKGDDILDPLGTATRAEIAKILLGWLS